MSATYSTRRFYLYCGACVGALIAGSGAAEASSVNFEDFNYYGTVTRYDTLTDAQNNVNGTPYTIQTATNGANSTLPDARDAYIYVDQSTGDFEFGTSWYFTPQEWLGNGEGYGNPNNSDNGFVQLYDTDSSSLTSLSMGWDSTLTQYSINATGANAGADEYARLWPAPNPGGASSISGGVYLDYMLSLTASFSSAAVSGDLEGVLPSALVGSFNALFENTGTDPTYNGYYTVALNFGNGSVAADDNYGSPYSGYDNFSQVIADTSFVAPVPLPPAWMLAGSGLLVVAAAGAFKRWRPVAAA